MKRALVVVVLWLSAALSGGAADFPMVAENGALRLTVESVRCAASYGENAAPQGRQWCVVRGSWANRIDAKRAAERELATQYLAETLASHLYLVIDGAAVGLLQPQLADEAGRPAMAAIALPKPGAVSAGDMVFDIPCGAYASAELRFYDDITGYLRLSLAGAPPEVKPVGPVLRNQVGEFALFAVADPAPGPAAPAGLRAVSVELRARSQWKTSGPAPQYDFAKPAGATVERINLMDWPDTRKSFLLLADGEYAYAAQGGTLPESARFLPEFFTGGTLIFLVPAQAKSLELVGTLGHAATEAGAIDIAPVRLSVGGGPAKPTAWTMSLKLSDEMFKVAVGVRRAATFAGEAAGEGMDFVVLDVGMENTGKGGEYFQPESQLQLVTGEGELLGCDEITGRGAHRPEAELYVPAGERRRCELVFRVASGTSPKLNFRGGSFEEKHELPLWRP